MVTHLEESFDIGLLGACTQMCTKCATIRHRLSKERCAKDRVVQGGQVGGGRQGGGEDGLVSRPKHSW